MNPGWWLTRVVLPVGIPVAALVVAAALVASSPTAHREEPQPRVTRVEVVVVEPTSAVARVYGTGVVTSRLALTPEVAGRVLFVSDALVPGGHLTRGDVVLRVDDRPYRAALDEQRARLAQARRDGVAHLDLVEGAVAHAEHELAATTVRAPTTGFVADARIARGQLLPPGAAVATLAGSEHAWVQVSVPVEQLRVLAVPDEGGAAGSEGVVRQRLSDGSFVERSARVLWVLGDLDPATRTARVLVEIDDPFAGDLPMLSGAPVEVVLDGGPLADSFVVPRDAVRDGEFLWVVGEGDLLEKRAIAVAWRDRDTIVVASGLRDGDRVVTSPLALPLPGMPVTTDGR